MSSGLQRAKERFIYLVQSSLLISFISMLMAYLFYRSEFLTNLQVSTALWSSLHQQWNNIMKGTVDSQKQNWKGDRLNFVGPFQI